MDWNPKTQVFGLSMGDLQVLNQCGVSVMDILRRKPLFPRLPPLWSVLSYALLKSTTQSPVSFWIGYREIHTLAQNRHQYYRPLEIPKASGGTRKLCAPCGLLRTHQEYIQRTILDALPVDPHAFAYRKGVEIADCARPHLGQEVLLHLDLADFFGSITEDMVFECLHSATGYSGSLCRLLSRLCTYKNRLPQGAVTSPTLSNLVFRPCDEALAALAESHGMQYSRYSDDLFFSGRKDLPLGDLLLDIRSILLSYGFRVNRDKTTVRGQQHRQSVLGLTVNDRLQTNRTYRRQLLQELYYLERFGRGAKGALEAGDYLRYLQQLQGKVNYALHIDPENSKLQEANFMLRLRIKHHREIYPDYS